MSRTYFIGGSTGLPCCYPSQGTYEVALSHATTPTALVEVVRLRHRTLV